LQHILQQLNYAGRSALDMFCNSLCALGQKRLEALA